MRLEGMTILGHYQHHQYYFLQSCFETLYCESFIQINLTRLIWLIYSRVAIFLQKCNYVLLKDYKISTHIGWSIQRKLLQEFSFGLVCSYQPCILGWMRVDRRESLGCSSPARLLSWWHFHGISCLPFTPSPSISERLAKVSLSLLRLP